MDKWLHDFAPFDPNYKNSDGTPNPSNQISANETSLIVSILSVGTFFGALAGAPFADILGRKWGLIASTGVFTVGVVLQTITSSSIALLIVGRVIAGAGVGLISMMVPLYQSEAAPKAIRGTLVSCYQLAITIGIFLAAVVNEGTHNRTDTGAYRIPIGIQLVWALILGTGMLLLPESPRFLIKKGDIEGAERAMGRLRGQDPKDPAIQAELAEIRANLEYELSLGRGTYADCFKGKNATRTWIGIWIQMFQQLTGVNFIFYYGTNFFKQSGISNAFVINVIVNVVNVVSTIPGLFLVERLGRRKILLFGACIMLVSQYIIAIVGVADPGSVAAGRVLIAFECIFIFGFAASWGPTAWVIPGEIMPLKIRGKSMSLATASNWLWNFILAYVTPYMVSTQYGNLGTKIGFVWGSTNVLCFLYVYFFVYETKGLALEEIDELFETTTPTTSASFVPSVKYTDKEAGMVTEEK